MDDLGGAVEPTSALSDDDIRDLCEAEYAAGKPSTEILAAQQLALKQYFLEPDGNEEEGQSQVQSSDVRDAVEGAMPIILDMFLASESPVLFKPAHANDIDQATQETIFCQYVLNTQNLGLLIIYQWFKDALLFKNGYVKAFWDASVDEEREDYDGLSADQYAALLADENYEVLTIAENPPMDPQGMILYSVQGKRKADAGQVRILNVPADRVRVSASWNSIDLTGCPYACHVEQITRSDLIVDGYDPAVVADLPAENTTILNDETSLNMNRRGDTTVGATTSTDPSRDTLTRCEHYIRADRDGDGIAELLKVCVIGTSGGTVLDIEEVDGHSLIACTPYVLPHSHFGLSLAELVGETQKIKTAILRQTLDNLYLSNNPGLAIDANNINNPEVLSQSRIGMLLLKRNANPVTEAVTVPFMAAQSLGVLEAVDQMSERKTGLSGETTGLDAEALAGSTNMVGAMTLNQAQLRMKLVISMLCETGVRPLMLRIRELVMKHMTREEMVQLGGKWVQINPRNWREKRNTQLRIGVGTVQKAERMQVLNMIIGLQKEIVAQQGGPDGMFVSPQNVYNTLSEVERLSDSLGTDRYFRNPASYTPPSEQPGIADEALQIEEAKVVVSAQKNASDAELKARELAIKEQEVGIKQQQAVTQRVSADANRMREATHGFAHAA